MAYNLDKVLDNQLRVVKRTNIPLIFEQYMAKPSRTVAFTIFINRTEPHCRRSDLQNRSQLHRRTPYSTEPQRKI